MRPLSPIERMIDAQLGFSPTKLEQSLIPLDCNSCGHRKMVVKNGEHVLAAAILSSHCQKCQPKEPDGYWEKVYDKDGGVVAEKVI